MTEDAVKEVFKDLLTLPSDRLAEAHDFILFLRSRYGRVVDVDDEWSDEDIKDITRASLMYASVIHDGESRDDPTG